MRISVGVVILVGVLLAAVVTHLRHHKHVELLTVPTVIFEVFPPLELDMMLTKV